MINLQPTTYNQQRLKITTIFVWVLLLAYCLVFSARADTPNNNNTFYYIFHLYYDNGQLSVDRDFQFKYDVIPGDFVADSVNTQFPYRGEVVNITGEIASRFEFDPKQGDVNFTKGKISIKAVYAADGQKVIFYDSQNQPVLTISVSDSSFCNDDGICNADQGEDSLNCSKDCKQSLSVIPTITPIPSADGSSGLWSSILYILGGLILIGLIWWFFKHRRNSGNMTLPPTPPAGATQ